MKIGRNDPCTCGSGKKYKKCCGSLAAEAGTPALASSASSPAVTAARRRLCPFSFAKTDSETDWRDHFVLANPKSHARTKPLRSRSPSRLEEALRERTAERMPTWLCLEVQGYMNVDGSGSLKKKETRIKGILYARLSILTLRGKKFS